MGLVGKIFGSVIVAFTLISAVKTEDYFSPFMSPGPIDDSAGPAMNPSYDPQRPDPTPPSPRADPPSSPRLPPGASPTPGVFDITSFGAVDDGTTDSSLALLAAWTKACAYEGYATMIIPRGTFFVGPVLLHGPCYNNRSPKVEIQGTLKAPLDLKAFTEETWITFQNLNGFELTGGYNIGIFDGEGEQAWSKCSSNKHTCQTQNIVRSISFEDITNGNISRIGVVNSKGFHLSFQHCGNIDIHDIYLNSPWNSPNTDGIHIGYSTDINITSSVIGVGDDCISIGPGSTNISVLNVTCGPGHGISIGSLGKYQNEEDVMKVSVKNCTIKDTQNGVRIKTWPGSPPSVAANITFQDIIMINASNPIIIDQEYCGGRNCGSFKPSQVKIANISFVNIRGTSQSEIGVALHCSEAAPCENVELLDIRLNQTDDADQEALLSFKGTIHGLEIEHSF